MNDKTQIAILSICIVLTLTLTFSIFIRGHDNSCEKCEIEFKTTKKSGVELPEPIILNEKVVNMYNELLKGNCLIKWDRVQGYSYG